MDGNETRRQSLLFVAAALRDPLRAPEIVASAMRQVKLWRKNRLCSSDYIDAWTNLLENPNQAADMLEQQSIDANQLRQNSPFVSIVRAQRNILYAAR